MGDGSLQRFLPQSNAANQPAQRVPEPFSERRHVFISYTRADREWVERIRQVMAPLLRQEGDRLQLWDDSQIQPGDRWLAEIETALAGAQVALLLVSAEFLASEFVMGREVPELLRAAEAEGVTILWVPLSACLVRHTQIHAFQAVLPPEQTLDAMGPPEQRLALVRIAEAVYQALRQSEQRARQRQERAAQEAAAAAEGQRAAAERQRQEQEQQAREQRQREAAAAREQQREQERERQDRERQEREARAVAVAAQRQRARQERIARAAQAGGISLPPDLRRMLPGPGLAQLPLSRRQLLIAAGGVPLAAIGVGRLAQGLLWPYGVPAGPYPLSTSHGEVVRQADLWQLRRHLIQVRAYVETLAPGVLLRLISIPAGRFMMGSPPSEPERSNDEGPQHELRLRSFLIGQTPITQAQWRTVAAWPKVRRPLNSDPSAFKGSERPVEQVSWHDAMEFCQRLSLHTGRSCTLPSEAQWEYACRAGTATPFSFGQTLTAELANYDANFTYADGPQGEYRQQTTPVGMFPANAWGLHDMHGNVWEWCLDHWHPDYNGAPSDGRAWLSGDDQSARLLRGGSWPLLPRDCRSAGRFSFHPDPRIPSLGFRVCCLPQD